MEGAMNKCQIAHMRGRLDRRSVDNMSVSFGLLDDPKPLISLSALILSVQKGLTGVTG